MSPNDVSDLDGGPNSLQNFPVVSAAISSGTDTTIYATLNSSPNTSFGIRFYSSGACDASGFGGWFLRMMGFAGNEPHIPKPVKLTLIDDKAALRAQLLRWAEMDSLKRILVSHGAIIDEDPARTLRELAGSLG